VVVQSFAVTGSAGADEEIGRAVAAGTATEARPIENVKHKKLLMRCRCI
jgi:hypothetical protein